MQGQRLRQRPLSTRLRFSLSRVVCMKIQICNRIFSRDICSHQYTFLKVRRPSLVFRGRYRIDNRRIIQYGCKLLSRPEWKDITEEILCTTNLECMYRYPAKVIKTHRFRYRKFRRNVWRSNTKNTIFRQYAFLVNEKQSSVT